MKRILQDSRTSMWCLSGLTVMVLMAGVLLEVGQAYTNSSSPVVASFHDHPITLHSHSSTPSNTKKSLSLLSKEKKKAEDPVHHHQVSTKSTAKKRMGFAMIFLGILAEKN